MAEAILKSLERHDMLLISAAGRHRILETLQSKSAPLERQLLRETLLLPPEGHGVPGIVRRRDGKRRGIPVGFPHPASAEGGRFKAAAHVLEHEVERVISPYELATSSLRPHHLDCAPREALVEIMETCGSLDGTIGLIGSAAVELLTGVPCLTPASDLDFLVRGRNLAESRERYELLLSIGTKKRVPIDAEVSLPNGYGVKAAELFSASGTVLGKSLNDVRLLERAEVERAFTKIARFTTRKHPNKET